MSRNAGGKVLIVFFHVNRSVGSIEKDVHDVIFV